MLDLIQTSLDPNDSGGIGSLLPALTVTNLEGLLTDSLRGWFTIRVIGSPTSQAGHGFRVRRDLRKIGSGLPIKPVVSLDFIRRGCTKVV